MNVLLITQEFPPNVLGGVGYHAYHLADALVDAGHDVHVLTGESAQHSQDASPPPLSNVEVSTISYRRTVAPRLWFARKAISWLESSTELETIDLIHSHEYIDFDAIPFDGVTVQKVHYNLTEKPANLPRIGLPRPFDDLAFSVANATIWRAERRLERQAIRSADLTIANSELTKRTCLEHDGVELSDIRVIYNGVDAERFSPGDESDTTTKLLFVGGDQERKGIDTVLDALRGLAPSSDVTLTVAGSIDALDTAELEATLPIDFVGQVGHDELVELYREATGLVHPAQYEPFGNVILEAWACGTPVVISTPSQCGAAELLEQGTGCSVDPEEPMAVAEAMHELVTTPDKFDPMACRRIGTRHTWDRVAAATITLARKHR